MESVRAETASLDQPVMLPKVDYAGEPHHAGASDPARGRGRAASRRDSAATSRDEDQAEAAAQARRFDQAEERKPQTGQEACGAAA